MKRDFCGCLRSTPHACAYPCNNTFSALPCTTAVMSYVTNASVFCHQIQAPNDNVFSPITLSDPLFLRRWHPHQRVNFPQNGMKMKTGCTLCASFMVHLHIMSVLPFFYLIFAILFLKMQTLSVNIITCCHSTCSSLS